MSLVKSKAIQLGFDATPTNNFLIYQPLTPDGTFRIANGNQGATTDIMTVTSGGSVTFAGTTNFSSLNFGAGTESAPSLFPTGDSNTGIWFPAADTFAVSTGGTERLRINSSGNVGIGLDPTAKFDVLGSIRSKVTTGEAQVMLTTDARQVYLFNSYSGNSYGLFDGTAAQHRMYYDANSNFWTFYTGASERLRIDSSGYVGIGLGGTAAAARLHISSSGLGDTGGLKITNSGAGGDTYRMWVTATINGEGAGKLIIGNDANNARLTLTQDGYIGLGITSPSRSMYITTESSAGQAMVQINNAGLTTSGKTSGYGGFSVGDGTVRGFDMLHRGQYATINRYGMACADYAMLESYGSATQGMIIGTVSATPIVLGTGSAERMRIDTSGRILAGQTSAWDSTVGHQFRAPSGITWAANINSLSNGSGYHLLITTGRPASSGDYLIQCETNHSSLGGSGTTMAFRVDGAGVATVGSGVKFPASQNKSSDANTLDDYEEGTFTPSMTFGGSSTGISYNYQSGYYVKIGQVVYFTIRIWLNNKGTSTGNLLVGGLPFANSAIGGGYLNRAFYARADSATYSAWQCYKTDNNSFMSIATVDGTTLLNNTHITNSTYFTITGTYETSD